MKSKLLVLIVFSLFIQISTRAGSIDKKWRLISSHQLQEAPDLTETVWELDRPPYGTYDKIALHQLKKTDLAKSEAVIVYFPPSGTNASLYTENIANAEKYDFRIYLAEKNYEIYSVDYRTAFVAGEEEVTDYSFMGDWTTEVFISDLRKAGKQVRKISGKKFFVAGHSTGGRYVYHFTAKNKSYVKGIISLDGGPWESDGSPASLYTMNLQQGLDAIKSGDIPESRTLLEGWGIDIGDHFYNANLGNWSEHFKSAIILYYSDGPDTICPEEWGSETSGKTVSEFLKEQFQSVWGNGQFSNIENGYADIGVLLAFITNCGTEWPIAEYLGDAYVGNWRGKMPDKRLSYFKNLKNIKIPLIVFSSEKWTTALGMQSWYKELGTVLIGSTDTEYVLLEGFGHLDVLMGTNAEKKVFEPLYQWLEERKK